MRRVETGSLLTPDRARKLGAFAVVLAAHAGVFALMARSDGVEPLPVTPVFDVQLFQPPPPPPPPPPPREPSERTGGGGPAPPARHQVAPPPPQPRAPPVAAPPPPAPRPPRGVGV